MLVAYIPLAAKLTNGFYAPSYKKRTRISTDSFKSGFCFLNHFFTVNEEIALPMAVD